MASDCAHLTEGDAATAILQCASVLCRRCFMDATAEEIAAAVRDKRAARGAFEALAISTMAFGKHGVLRDAGYRLARARKEAALLGDMPALGVVIPGQQSGAADYSELIGMEASTALAASDRLASYSVLPSCLRSSARIAPIDACKERVLRVVPVALELNSADVPACLPPYGCACVEDSRLASTETLLDASAAAIVDICSERNFTEVVDSKHTAYGTALSLLNAASSVSLDRCAQVVAPIAKVLATSAGTGALTTALRHVEPPFELAEMNMLEAMGLVVCSQPLLPSVRSGMAIRMAQVAIQAIGASGHGTATTSAHGAALRRLGIELAGAASSVHSAICA